MMTNEFIAGEKINEGDLVCLIGGRVYRARSCDNTRVMEASAKAAAAIKAQQDRQLNLNDKERLVMSECEHIYGNGGIKYEVTGHSIPGTSAKEIIYYQAYFCQKCLSKKFEELSGRSSTLHKVEFGAVKMGRLERTQARGV